MRGIKTACSAESFLTLHLRIACGACQQAEWEDEWEARLERANAFLHSLEEQGSLAVDKVAQLVTQLESDYKAAAWSARSEFGPGPTSRVNKVKHAPVKRTSSPLRQEVQPEEVPDREVAKGWLDMTEEDYDGDYVGYTDPLHPINTDYNFPSMDQDDSWLIESGLDATHLSDDTTAEDENLNNYQWGDSHNDPQDPSTPDLYWSNSSDPNTLWNTSTPTSTEEPFTQLHQDAINETIASFWSYIANPSDLHNASASPSPSPPPSSPSPSFSSPPPPPTAQTSLQDPLPNRKLTNSTYAWYDNQRRILLKRKDADLDKYYADWLYISRCEIMDLQGPHAKAIAEP